jgi:hypothetical protein
MSDSVLLAVGHGINPKGTQDPGAVSKDWSEQRAMDIVVSVAAASLRMDGRLRVFDEAYQDDPNFIGTTKKANELKVSILVEAHQDWSGGLYDVYGFWFPGSEEGELLTRTILKEYKEGGLPINDKWTKARSNLYILKNSEMPATLLEHGRVGDPDWTDVEKLESVGLLLAQGVINYFGYGGPALNPVTDSLPEKPKKPAPEPTSETPEAPKFPLPKGHWFGAPSSNPRNHSGYYWKADSSGIHTAQSRLRDRGWRISVDGKFGPDTDKVVRSFQREKNLRVDGLLGLVTWKTLWTAPVT